MIKTLKPGIEENFLKIIKGIYEKSWVKIILNSEGLKVFPLRSGTRQVFHSHHFCSTLYWRPKPEQLDKEKIKDTRLEKKEVKWSLFADDLTWYMASLKEYTHY